MRRTMVVSVFAGCGKTWLTNHQNQYGYSMRDSDSSTYEKTANGETPMSESDAKTIVDAFMKYKDRVEQIIVHCDAGYSRSPAVAAALAKALGMSDEVYFSSGQYCPNRHVYRMMMNELAARNFFD